MFAIEDFNHQAFIAAAEELLRSDETLMALKLLDMVPAYFRDHPIPELHALKREIQAKIATASFYATHEGFELTITDEMCLGTAATLRNQLISFDVKRCNDEKMSPHIYDMGPGEGALPVVLDSQKFEFTYSQVYVNQPTYEATAHRWEEKHGCNDLYLKGLEAPRIFVSTEVIEHLHYEDEIRAEMERACGLADVIHISTPLYTYNPTVKNWRDIGHLGHLRTYTPNEFRNTISRMFPEFQYAYYESQVQHMRLFNPKSKFDVVKANYQIKS